MTLNEITNAQMQLRLMLDDYPAGAERVDGDPDAQQEMIERLMDLAMSANAMALQMVNRYGITGARP